MARDVVGLVWRNIPKVSQYKLSTNNDNNFENFCAKTIDDYHKLYIEYSIQAKNEKQYLMDLGCSKVVTVPHAVGNTKTILFNKFISELPEYSFVLLKSFSGFGNTLTLHDCMDSAVSRKIYIITEKHLGLMHFPNECIGEVYYDWIRKNSYTKSFNINDKQEKINDLIGQGLSANQIQSELGISKSAYYRMVKNI
jgi:hypothetical protein